MGRSKSEINDGEFEGENLVNPKEPYLSGACIRSFVKQLTSSRTKDSPDMREKGSNLEREGNSREQDLSGEPHHPPQPRKKQVRRRLHTRKPYQEKLLNMAEARREIVTALKLHRAAMKQAREKLESGPDFQSEQLKSSTRNPRIQASNSYTSGKFPVNCSDNYNFVYSPGFVSPYSIAPPPIFQENLDFAPLPTQTLGLNLNLQDFVITPSSSIYSSSSPSTSSSPPPSAATEEIPVATSAAAAAAEVAGFGDQNQIEGFNKNEEFVSSTPFDGAMEFPAWLNANGDESCLQHVLNDFCTQDYFQDPALPCMEIEEIDGMDGDWLA